MRLVRGVQGAVVVFRKTLLIYRLLVWNGGMDRTMATPTLSGGIKEAPRGSFLQFPTNTSVVWRIHRVGKRW